jgi:D-alanine--poly(phosphoribitol) ligase subunit 2
MNPPRIREVVRGWLLTELLPGEQAENLPDDLDLYEAGILDSLSILRLVDMLEDRFDIEVDVGEAGRANFATVDRVVRYLVGKLGAGVG